MNQVFHLYPLSFQNYINHRGKNNMYEKRSAANMLRAVGMHPKYKGYAYVLCILEKTGMEPERLYGSAGEMYRLVEEKFGIKRAAMERCIRFAIQRTWETGNDKLKELFGAYDVCCMPTITEFLAVMTEGLCCGRGGRRA